MRRGRYNGTDEQSRENATKALLNMLMWQGIVSDSQSAAQNASMRERFGMRISEWLSSAALSAKSNDTGSMLRAELWESMATPEGDAIARARDWEHLETMRLSPSFLLVAALLCAPKSARIWLHTSI